MESFPVLPLAAGAGVLLILAYVLNNPSTKSLALFAYNCFLKPISKSSSDQQVALESFYKGQAQVYDRTRSKLLKGRELMLQLCSSHSKKIQNLVWVDIGGGTGWNIEQMNEYRPISSFKAVYLVDLSPSLCEVARERFKRRGWKNVHVLCIDANDFSVPSSVGTHVDLITMSYSLSMIPGYYSVVDKLAKLLNKDGIYGVVDFYVQSSASMMGKSPTVGGQLLRHVNWFSRTFWRLWFEFDQVYLDPARRDYLEYKLGTVKSLNFRNKALGGIPYYVFVGTDKDYSSDITTRINAVATESPYLAPVSPHASSQNLQNESEKQLVATEIQSKGYQAAIINMERNCPYPSFFYQREIWRIYYDFDLPKYNQFAGQYIYAFTWEDPREDIKILDVKPTDTMLAITSAGDNILAYAAMDKAPRRIHGVDLNPHQNHLMELKLASMRALSFDDVWKIFGEGKHENFMELLSKKLSPHMSSHALQYWMRVGKKTFDPKTGKGLYDTGSTRWALRIARWVFKLAGVESDVVELCESKTLEEQLRIWKERVRPALFSPIVTRILVANPVFLWKALGVPLNQASMIDGGILRYIIDTIEPLLSRSLISTDNYFYYLCLMGRYSRENCPDYITRTGYNNLAKRKGALDGIRLHTDTINDVVERIRPGSVNHAIVMDHMDWFSPTGTDAREEIRALNKALIKGGNVMLRSSSTEPWYLRVYEEEGFECRAAGVRRAGNSIDRVNMYASTWVCTKKWNATSDVVDEKEAAAKRAVAGDRKDSMTSLKI